VTISPKAILGTVHLRAIKNHLADQNLILAAHLPAMTDPKAISGMVQPLAIKKAFRHAANHTLAARHPAIATDRKEASAQVLPRPIENLTLAGHLAARVKKDQKEALATALPAIKNHTHRHVPVPQIPTLAISQKEVLVQVPKDQQTKNLMTGPKADLKNAKAAFQKINRLIMPTGHNVSLLTIR
jgi:hypothetical protein